MTQLAAEARTASALEVVIHRPDGGGRDYAANLPQLGQVCDVLEALDDFIRAVLLGLVADVVSRAEGTEPVEEELSIPIPVTDHRVLAALREPEVRLRRMSMNSPLIVELAATGVTGAGLISAVVYLFKNPDKIGSWLPKLQASWYNGQVEVEKARKAYEKLRKARTEMRELER